MTTELHAKNIPKFNFASLQDLPILNQVQMLSLGLFQTSLMILSCEMLWIFNR